MKALNFQSTQKLPWVAVFPLYLNVAELFRMIIWARAIFFFLINIHRNTLRILGSG